MRLQGGLFSVFAVILPTRCCGSGAWSAALGFARRGLLTGLTGDEWRSWVLQRHLWRTHIVASPGEKTEQSGNTGGISYCDVISHKTFSFSQMKEGEKRGKRWRDGGTGKDGGGTKGWTTEGVEEIQKTGWGWQEEGKQNVREKGNKWWHASYQK